MQAAGDLTDQRFIAHDAGARRVPVIITQHPGMGRVIVINGLMTRHAVVVWLHRSSPQSRDDGYTYGS
jgi:hypothetical protein